MEVGLFQTQSLRVVMSKELSQAISLLQYSYTEILTFLQEQAMQNPLMDFQELGSTSLKSDRHSMKPSIEFDQLRDDYESLQEHLISQLHFLPISSEEELIITYLIYSLNEYGYLDEDIEYVSEVLGKDREIVKSSLKTLQQLEPSGVGARNLSECLWIQLKRKKQETPLALQLLKDHFEAFALKKWEKLSRELNVTTGDIQEINDQIIHLNPRPGLQYLNERHRYITPDFIVKKVADRYDVHMNAETDFTIRLNQQYMNVLAESRSTEAKAYLEDKQRELQWIMKSLNTRKQTLQLIMEALLIEQEAFFSNGMAYMKPLTMKQLADKIGVHESTISRAIRNKYVETSFGTYEMNVFFNSRVSEDGEASSSAQIKEAMQTLIANENRQKPLSDQQLTKLLKEAYNMSVSRRTVAKYRDELHILPSSQRKVYVC
ncbi:RNA polymerase factor sigma-54 [Priestia koreensis]|uniref:RNA polymerase factor sigma-54 n=1 Tax=Priestia koreensis TaxID=284581 RepID=UPI0030195DE8